MKTATEKMESDFVIKKVQPVLLYLKFYLWESLLRTIIYLCVQVKCIVHYIYIH